MSPATVDQDPAVAAELAKLADVEGQLREALASFDTITSRQRLPDVQGSAIALLEGRPLAEAAAASEADVRRVGHCVAVLREARALQLRKVEAAREPARRAIEDRERPAAKKMLNAALAKIRQGVRELIAY